MGLRYLGGFISAAYNSLASNITTGANTVQTQGIYTLPQQAQALPNQQWVTDPNFKNTTLLLQADGKVNGSQNNTFLDSSSNNFTITRNGNTTQGTFSPFSPGWSVFFNNTNFTNIYAASSADFNFGSGDFTIECFFNSTNAMSTAVFFRLFDTGQLSCFFYNGSIFLRNAAGNELVTVVAHGLSVGVWYHLAFVRSGTTYSIYRNGVLLTSGTGGTVTSASAPFIIGTNTSYNQPLSGYVSNFRVTTGQALYTTTFTPTTTSLTTTSQSATASNVKLLTLQSNGFVDNSTQNTKTILFGDNGSNLGTRSVQSFAPFAPQNQVYAGPDTNASWSNYFNYMWDGTNISGAYAVVNGNSNFNSTGDFTLEAWVYPMGNSGENGIVSFTSITDAGVSSGGAAIRTGAYSSGSTIGVTFAIEGGATGGSATSVLSINKWSHVALVRSGSTSGNCSCYINGVRVNTFTATRQVNGASNVCTIGKPFQSNDAVYPFNFTGYISNLRYVVGTAIYSGATYTVPTQPLTAVSGTQLLTCQSSTLKDNSSNNFTVAVPLGGVQVQPFNPFSSSYVTGGSAYFDGTGDYLTLPPGTAFAPGTGSFTVDGWIYSGSNTLQTIWAQTVGGTNYFVVEANYPSSVVRITSVASGGGTAITSAATLRLNAWNYFCISRALSGTITVWCNGSPGTPTSNNINLTNTTYTPTIGTYSHSTTTNVLVGYLANLRYIKNVALSGAYSPALAPPSPNLAVTNTQALLNYTNAGIYDAAMDNVLETVGNAQVSTSVVKYGSGSLAFDGTGDYLSMPSTATNRFGSANWTMELWFRTPAATTRQIILGWNAIASGYGACIVNFLANGKIGLQISESGSSWKFDDTTTGVGSALSANTWYHLVVTRVGQIVTVYINGVSIGTYSLTASTTSLMTNGIRNVVGINPDLTNQPFNGYIDDLRVTIGVARYTANFTPPKVALPRQ